MKRERSFQVAVQSETELYLPVKTFLEKLGYAVKSEIHGCDIVAIRREEEEPIVVELKKTFNLALLFQGINRLKMTNTVYLAVEYTNKKRGSHQHKWNDIMYLCRLLGLGLLAVQFYKTKKPVIEVLCEPVPYVPRQTKKRAAGLLREFRERSGDYNVGGSSQRKLITAYREKALHCAHLLHTHGRLSPKQLRELTGSSKVGGILQKNFYGWFRRAERGIYELTPAGEEALRSYSDVVEEIK
jgi:hypothetical protein